MANMSYCRFRNTVNDLRDCVESMTERLCEEENDARRDLVRLCVRVLDEVGIELDPDAPEIDEQMDLFESECLVDGNEEY